MFRVPHVWYMFADLILQNNFLWLAAAAGFQIASKGNGKGLPV
jgi:hypothetical protein